MIEHVSMVAAASLGLDVAATEYMEFADRPAIVVERFDRAARAGRLVRVHQEDFCQTFGLDPIRKYEADRGPGVQRIAERLREVTTDGSVRRFVRAVIVNYLLGAPDAHAKNYSMLLVGPAARLAPLYDVASGLTVERDGELRYPKAAMSIGGERAFGQVRGRHWERLASRVGIPAEEVRSWVVELAEELPDALADALNGVTLGTGRPSVRLLQPRVQELAEQTLAALSDPSG